MDIIINVQGFIFPDKEIVREISWIHLKLGIGETISVFIPDYVMNDQEKTIVRRVTRDMHGLGFKSHPDDKGLWISNDEVKEYFQQLHRLYGGTFGFKGGVITLEKFKEWEIPVEFLDLPKCVKVKGPGCSMYRCLYYKNIIEKNNLK